MEKNFKTLINIKLYELTGNEIGLIKKNEIDGNKFYSTIIPEYSLNNVNGFIRYTREYLYWVESGEEKYFLFKAHTSDDILNEEISNCDLIELFEKIDIRPYFNKLDKLTYNDLINGSLFSGQYLIINIKYVSGNSYLDNSDYTLNVSIDGVLKNDLTILKI